MQFNIPQLSLKRKLGSSMKPFGYHAHVYFDSQTEKEAELLYGLIGNMFPNVRLGTIHDRPLGPHTKPMFQVLLTPEMFGPVVSWLMLNRAGLDVLVHPETGDEIADHTKHVLWLGSPVALDLNGL